MKVVEKEREKERGREREREREKRYFDSSKIPGQDLSTVDVPVVQVDIQLQRRSSTLVQDISFIICETIEMWT